MAQREAVLSVVEAAVHNFMVVRDGQNTIRVLVNFLIHHRNYEGGVNLTNDQANGITDELILASRDGVVTRVAVDANQKPVSLHLSRRELIFSDVLEDKT